MTDNRALRRVTAARQAITEADQTYAQALRSALTTHPSDEVARAAGVTRSAMYKTLRKTFGPRKVERVE
jgi:DNA-binding phage protein